MCAAIRKLRLNPPSDEGYVEIKKQNFFTSELYEFHTFSTFAFINSF